MKLKRIAALLISLALIVSVVTGCVRMDDNGLPVSPSPADSADASASPSGAEAAGIDFDAAFAAFGADTVMISGDGCAATWEEVFLYICLYINEFEYNYGSIPDWSTPLSDGRTIKDAVLAYATSDVAANMVISYGASQLGAELSEADLAALSADYASAVEERGGEEGLMAYLKEIHCNSIELFNYINEVGYLAKKCFDTLYGEDLSLLSDEDVAEYTADEGYLKAKHIIRMTKKPDETGNPTVEMTDEEKAAVYAETEEILAKLDAYEGDDFDAYFDELMLEESQDAGGLQSYPGGYLFKKGDMMEEFYEGCAALEPGKYSEIITTSYGYHIIYRLPIDYDEVPYAYSNQGMNYSLRYITATDLFNIAASGWQESMGIVYSDEYKTIDLAKIFILK